MPALQSAHAPFFDNPAIDHLVSMVIAVSAELTVVSEQLDSLKRLLVAHNILSADAIATFIPPDQALRERETARRTFIAALMQSLHNDAVSRRRESREEGANG